MCLFELGSEADSRQRCYMHTHARTHARTHALLVYTWYAICAQLRAVSVAMHCWTHIRLRFNAMKPECHITGGPTVNVPLSPFPSSPYPADLS